MISIHLYLYMHVINDMEFYLSKEKRKLNHLKPTYMSNYLNKMKQKIIIIN
jgi:hypothetical protein